MKVYITRQIPESGINKLKEKGYEVDINSADKVLSREELLNALKQKPYDAVLCLLTDKIDKEVFGAVPTAKIFANYAVGFDNINLADAKEKNVMVVNTPGVLTETVAEHTFALMLAIAHRVSEADRFTRAGNYKGWAPMLLLGANLAGKTLGIVGLGRIGSTVAGYAVRGFGAKIIYYDVNRNEDFEKEFQAEYRGNVDDVLKEADFISIHVPLLESTRHLINKERLAMMKPTAYLVNTSRGPVIDEQALVEALKNKIIKGAALDVFENEPALALGLAELENVILTPHIASATEETRSKMSDIAAENIIVALEGRVPPNLVK
ncbi:D-glycerate dehydrogenase [Patescibacteria group bacterium]|nr:D-glycerate dehydrogenase [Patescibacteria group bacterium]MBU4353678.1 D-glycerate dehydrogenase [Patescibacteria group bacterium]MBU4477382.1 D-glycerate dehydrogenase [Patescibacteria group bacterium]MCG2699431.1 D-glycerate dehydrogenase [Candidatus Parcubacteria bacterium]